MYLSSLTRSLSILTLSSGSGLPLSSTATAAQLPWSLAFSVATSPAHMKTGTPSNARVRAMRVIINSDGRTDIPVRPGTIDGRTGMSVLQRTRLNEIGGDLALPDQQLVSAITAQLPGGKGLDLLELRAGFRLHDDE